VAGTRFPKIRILEIGRSYIGDHEGESVLRALPVVGRSDITQDIQDVLGRSPLETGEHLVLSPPDGSINIEPFRVLEVVPITID